MLKLSCKTHSQLLESQSSLVRNLLDGSLTVVALRGDESSESVALEEGGERRINVLGIINDIKRQVKSLLDILSINLAIVVKSSQEIKDTSHIILQMSTSIGGGHRDNDGVVRREDSTLESKKVVDGVDISVGMRGSEGHDSSRAKDLHDKLQITSEIGINSDSNITDSLNGERLNGAINISRLDENEQSLDDLIALRSNSSTKTGNDTREGVHSSTADVRAFLVHDTGHDRLEHSSHERSEVLT